MRTNPHILANTEATDPIDLRPAQCSARCSCETSDCETAMPAPVLDVVTLLTAIGADLSFGPVMASGDSSSRDDGSTQHAPQATYRLGYEAHIGSAAWRNGAARQAELEASGNRCRICNRGRAEVRLEVHHRTYQNFGHESPDDLTTLCSECHVVNTDMLRRRRYAFYSPLSRDAAPAHRCVVLFDPMAPGEAS